MSEIIDLTLIKKLIHIGAVKSNRAIHYKDFVVNDFYLSSESNLMDYCSRYAFDQKKSKNKRKIALELSTLLLNYSK